MVAFDPGMSLVLFAVGVHRVPVVRKRLHRNDGRRMRPVLGHQPVRIVQRPEQRRVIGSQPAPEDRLVGTGDDADRVELNAAQSADRLQQTRFLRGGIAGRPRPAVEPRGDHRQRSGFLDRQELAVTAASLVATESPSPCAQGEGLG